VLSASVRRTAPSRAAFLKARAEQIFSIKKPKKRTEKKYRVGQLHGEKNEGAAEPRPYGE
jgi:hypothetical protein